MRIVGGKWKGLAVEAPEGRGTTRPTTDRNRERIASMILSAAGLDLTGTRVLDAFAGSGAMGFELVSRGAASATFVDLDRRAVARIRRTAERSLRADASEWRALAGDACSLAEELYHEALHLDGSVYNEPWPEFDPELAKSDEVEIAVQIKGKVRGHVTVAADAADDEVAEAAKAAVADQLEGKDIKKVIVIKGRLVNIVAI